MQSINFIDNKTKGAIIPTNEARVFDMGNLPSKDDYFCVNSKFYLVRSRVFEYYEVTESERDLKLKCVHLYVEEA